MNLSRLHKNALIIIPIIFLLFSAPNALDYIFHFPDEKYYTDAVLQMMEKEDYFTPYQADGTPRFKKPIITYWVLMASYKLFDVSRISSRLFFWLAGALLIIVSYLMAKSLSGNKKLATTNAFILASNPMVMMSASRSIPDILLVLFLTISAWGFLEILVSTKPKKKHFWLAYLGAALAFETKGIPAVAFAGVSILYILFNPWKKKKLVQILDPASICTSIIIAFSWFFVMYFEHGSVYLQSFFDDQIGNRVSSKLIQVFTNVFSGTGYLILYLIPWVIIAFSRPKKLKDFINESPVQTKAIFGFILSWIVLIIIMAGTVFKFYDRYLLPVFPLISLFFAFVFTHSDTRFKNKMLKIFLILTINILVFSIIYSVFIAANIVLIICLIISSIFLLSLFFGRFKKLNIEIKIAGAVMLLYFIGFAFLYPLLMPNPGKQLVENINNQGIQTNEKIYVYGNIRTASNIRIHSANQMQVISMNTDFTLPADKNHIVVFSKKEEPFLDLSNYTISNGSEEWYAVPVNKFPEFLQPAIAKLKNSGTFYYIATPKNTNP